MLKTTLKVALVVLLLLYTAATKADSFFDVFFDVSYDAASGSPVLMAKGRVVIPGTGSRTVDTEILSMSLSSHRGMNGSNHSATVQVRSWIPNDKGKTLQVDSFFDVIVECSISDEKRSSCAVSQVTPKRKHEHRGHVTVLK